MLPLFTALGLLIVGTVLLVVGADWFLDGAGDLARTLGVSALVLGVVLAGLEPEEILTAAIASARGAPTLAVGNVIGTNVTIVTMALASLRSSFLWWSSGVCDDRLSLRPLCRSSPLCCSSWEKSPSSKGSCCWLCLSATPWSYFGRTGRYS